MTSQIKAEDSGDPPLWSVVKLHVDWIRKPVPSPLPLVFTQRLYNFSVSETAAVAQPVGVVAVSQSNTPVWFNIVGKMVNAHTHLAIKAMNCNRTLGGTTTFLKPSPKFYWMPLPRNIIDIFGNTTFGFFPGGSRGLEEWNVWPERLNCPLRNFMLFFFPNCFGEFVCAAFKLWKTLF